MTDLKKLLVGLSQVPLSLSVGPLCVGTAKPGEESFLRWISAPAVDNASDLPVAVLICEESAEGVEVGTISSVNTDDIDIKSAGLFQLVFFREDCIDAVINALVNCKDALKMARNAQEEITMCDERSC